MTAFDYINKHYSLSVRRGSRVVYGGDSVPKQGRVTSAQGARINIRFDGESASRGPFHPTWAITYLEQP